MFMLKTFIYTAYKPIEELLEGLEDLMRMDKVMNTQSEHWEKHNDKIPLWFYQMLISMGISVLLGFTLILIGCL